MGWPVGCRSTAALCAGFPTAGLPEAPGKAHRHSRAIATCDPERPARRSQTHTSNSKKMGLPDRQQMVSQCKDVPSIAQDTLTLRKIHELKSSVTGRSVSYPAPQGWDGPGGGRDKKEVTAHQLFWGSAPRPHEGYGSQPPLCGGARWICRHVCLGGNLLPLDHHAPRCSAGWSGSQGPAGASQHMPSGTHAVSGDMLGAEWTVPSFTFLDPNAWLLTQLSSDSGDASVLLPDLGTGHRGSPMAGGWRPVIRTHDKLPST